MTVSTQCGFFSIGILQLTFSILDLTLLINYITLPPKISWISVPPRAPAAPTISSRGACGAPPYLPGRLRRLRFPPGAPRLSTFLLKRLRRPKFPPGRAAPPQNFLTNTENHQISSQQLRHSAAQKKTIACLSGNTPMTGDRVDPRTK